MPVIIQPGRFGPTYNPLSLTWTRYFDYSDASSVTLNGSTISQINDQSGNAGHATQGTAANQPTYTLAGQHGQNVGTFDGGDILSTPTFTQAQPMMVYVVVRISSLAAGAMSFFNGDSGNVFVVYKLATTHLWSMFSGSTVRSAAVAADTNWHVLVARFEGASSYLMLDGTTIITGLSPGTAGLTADAINMGASTAAAGQLIGQYGFAGMGLHSDADRDAMVAHLKAKWGIT